MKSDRRVPVAIVGGGYSGSIVAAELARRGIGSALIDGSGRIGRGVAYSTDEPAHLLNLRAEAMSAWSHDPDHFARHFEAAGGERRGFAERRFFGRYLDQILDDAVDGGHVTPVHAAAIEASRNGVWTISLDDGSALGAASLVLAIGNQQPLPLPAFASVGKRYVGNPWGADARAAITELAEIGGTAVLVGTGLTMIDVALSLDSAGHSGRIVALSRRGQVPRAHADFAPAPVEENIVPHGNLVELWRWLRRRSAEVGWRAAVDSLRPHSHGLWQSLNVEQKRRFLRHARPWWDVHRHRIAPEVAGTVTRMVAEGRLEILAAKIESARETADAVEISIRRRGQANGAALQAAFVFNCTGPLHAIQRTVDPLLRSLLDAGAVRSDNLGIGLDSDQNSRVGERLWALGPLTKARYWEIVAVPDIREQAAAVADDIERELHG